jgi:hypothetical protein
MFGVKINEFDNTDGTSESFNKIFPDTPLCGNDIEILDIHDVGDVYTRNIKVDGEIIVHSFGEENFINTELMPMGDKFQYKYFARNLNGDILSTAYSCKDLAEKMDCNIMVIKRRLVKEVNQGSKTEHLFNVTRIGL